MDWFLSQTTYLKGCWINFQESWIMDENGFIDLLLVQDKPCIESLIHDTVENWMVHIIVGQIEFLSKLFIPAKFSPLNWRKSNDRQNYHWWMDSVSINATLLRDGSVLQIEKNEIVDKNRKADSILI